MTRTTCSCQIVARHWQWILAHQPNATRQSRANQTKSPEVKADTHPGSATTISTTISESLFFLRYGRGAACTLILTYATHWKHCRVAAP